MPAYLIKYHRPTGALEVTEYESLIEGTRARHRLDQVNKDPDVEIVAIGAKNLESVRHTHARYFFREKTAPPYPFVALKHPSSGTTEHRWPRSS